MKNPYPPRQMEAIPRTGDYRGDFPRNFARIDTVIDVP
jgi:hypothetical protein